MSTNGTAAENARQELGAGFEGELIGPDDAQYEEARALFNAMIDKRPALIARCASPEDVTRVIGFARAHDLPLAIRGGGHNGGGLGSVDDGVIADLSLLRSISVDPETRTVRVGGGCTWKEVDAATNPHGLAVPCGIISTTGVGGLTLGGGIGHLTRGYGLTIDNLLGAEVVLADGQRVNASADENPDLFWAVRGGGGNFGVVTEFTFQAHPVSDIVGGPTFWPIEETEEVLKAYREFLPTLARNATGFFCWHTVPPGPPFPEEIHMRKICGIVWCIVGSDEEAEQAMAPMLAVAPPLMQGAARMPLPALNSAFDGLYGPGDQWYWRADFVNEIPDEAVTRNAEWNEKMPSWKSGSHIYPIDGAAHDVGKEETAWAYRDTRWAQVIIGVDPDPATAPVLRDWTVGYWEALHPYSAGGAYVNFMMDEGQERVKATYGSNYDRL
ncbi:MAG: FAD-binding oxidoreductase, partial [Actinomycetota bacterium]|nr:FAD-binding oxidoreductase [Actinomycetota bacterium]